MKGQHELARGLAEFICVRVRSGCRRPSIGGLGFPGSGARERLLMRGRIRRDYVQVDIYIYMKMEMT